MKFRADLHSHTTCSDGSLTPEELLHLAVESGLSGLSITDHDTIAAYDVAIPLAKELGIELLTGIEFSARDRNDSVHILGYGYSLEDEALRKFCDEHVIRREERNSEILALLEKHDMSVSETELKEFGGRQGEKVYGRPHIAQVMMNKGYIVSVDEAFRKWIGEGKPCYSPGREVTIDDTIDTIHAAGGKAVIAHPHLIRSRPLIDKLLQKNFDGIEGYYALFPSHVERPWINRAKERGWIVTGGSDFHGAPKPHLTLGCSWVDEETFRALQR